MHQLVDGATEGPRIAKQRGDVAKQDAGLGVIGDGADRRKQRVFEGEFHCGAPLRIIHAAFAEK